MNKKIRTILRPMILVLPGHPGLSPCRVAKRESCDRIGSFETNGHAKPEMVNVYRTMENHHF